MEPSVSSKDSRGERPLNPEAQKVTPAVEGIPEAPSGPEVQWTADPGTAANDTLQVLLWDAVAISGDPCRAVGGRPVVVIMLAILHPLPHVARQGLSNPPYDKKNQRRL